ncbi:MAG: hypothetical protein AAGG75_24390 [Bacteroidota bacterium]
MANRFNKIQRNVSSREGLLPGSKKTFTSSHTLGQIKHWAIFIGVVLLLGGWIGLSLMNNGLFLNEALICSAIISALLFFRAVDQNKQIDRNN